MSEKQVVVVGTGTMGPGIAAVFALGGWRTTLVGRTSRSAELGLERARFALDSLETLGLAPSPCAPDAARRLGTGTDLDAAAAGAHVVVESIVEDLDAKRECFRRVGDAAPPEAVLVTNTSGLSITRIAEAAARPARVAGMHWWNPPHLIPLVEVVRGEQTDEAVLDRVVDIARGLGKQPVVVRRDVPGFVGNRLQYALVREAMHLVDAGVASADDVDRAMRWGPGLRYGALGPLEAADFIGLDVVASIMGYLLPALADSPEPPELLARLVSSGRLGVKRGRGFHDYAGRPTEEVVAERDRRLAALPGVSSQE